MATIFLEYFYWHYAIAPTEILRIMGNYLKGAQHQFMMSQHFKTLFAPWHRQNPSDLGKRDRNFTDKVLDFVADIYIRLIAAFIRLLIILTGLCWQLLLILSFVVLLVIWLSWPLISVYSVVNGVNLLLTMK